jgi:hypothetical protein
MVDQAVLCMGSRDRQRTRQARAPMRSIVIGSAGVAEQALLADLALCKRLVVV